MPHNLYFNKSYTYIKKGSNEDIDINTLLM